MDMLKVIELRGGTGEQENFKPGRHRAKGHHRHGWPRRPEEWLNMIDGGVAAKGLKDDAFYYQMEPMVQEMGGDRVGTSLMSAYQNMYQGAPPALGQEAGRVRPDGRQEQGQV